MTTGGLSVARFIALICSSPLALLGLHVLAKKLIDACLIARALPLEPLNHIGIKRIVTACFTGTRSSARRKKSSSSSGISLVSMSASSNLAKRSQSVFDGFDITYAPYFVAIGRRHADLIASPFGVANRASHILIRPMVRRGAPLTKETTVETVLLKSA
jgi:hypothetical protein